MSGTQTTTQQQQSQTAPWVPAQGALTGVLNQLNPLIGQTGVNGTQQGAINQIENNNSSLGSYTPQISNYLSSMFNGGNALAQSGNVANAYNAYQKETSPLASNTNYNPYNTPGFSDALSALNNSISNQVNGSFAAAGRDGSPANSQALATGLSQGEGQLIENQYNQNVQNQQAAAQNLYGAGNTTAGLQTGLQNQYNTNQGTALGSVGTGVGAANAAPTSTLAAASQQLGIPIQQLGSLASIIGGIGGLGSQSSGNATSQTSTPWYSGVGALGGLFSGGSNSAFNGMSSAAGGIFSGLGGLLAL